jgi:tetratricopeptide (TPR) repeat protein
MMVRPDLPVPDPRRIATRLDFGRELRYAKDHAGLTVRRIATLADLPPATVGGYLSATHLPNPSPPDVLERILRACGIKDPAAIREWYGGWSRARQASSALSAPDGLGDDIGSPPSRRGGSWHVSGDGQPIPVSTVPPFGRLDGDPALRGRGDVLTVLAAAIAGAGEGRVHVLHGLGGCGKSAIALAAARAAAGSGTRCWWLAARSDSALAAGMAAIAIELGATPGELRLGGLPDIAWRLLNALTEPWLLILDDVDDPTAVLPLPGHPLADGRGWLRPPASGNGTVIVTTRDGSADTWGRPASWIALYRVSALDAETGAEVLRDVAGQAAATRADAIALSSRLGGLPLALVLAGRYLREAAEVPGSWSSPDLPRDCGAYLAALDPPAGQRTGELADPVRPVLDSAWELSLALLTGRGLGNATALLQLLSCLGAAPVPYELLLRAEILSLSPAFAPMSPEQLWATLRGLDGVGLIDLNPAPAPVRLLTIHPVVREISRDRPRVRGEAPSYLTLTTALLGPVVALSDPKHPANWDRWRLLADHCGAPLDLIGEHPVGDPGRADEASYTAPALAVELAAKAAGFLRAAGHLGQASAAYASIGEIAARKLPPRDPQTLAIRHDVARLRYDQRRLAEAEQEFRDVVSLRTAILGADHPDTLTSCHYMARVLRDLGQFDEAAELLHSTLNGRLRILGEMHPDTITSRNGIADLLRSRGELAAARTAYREVLDQRVAVLGERHPATLTTRHYLILVQYQLDDPTAVDELRDLVTVNTQVRGATHPRTLAAVHTLVEALHDAGELTEALPLARRLAGDRDQILGPAHPLSLASRYRLGLIALDSDEEAATAILDTVLSDSRRFLGPAHPLTEAAGQTIQAVQRRTDIAGA